MTADELNQFIQARCPTTAAICPDVQYAHPTRDWVFRQFAPAFRSLVTQLGEAQWIEESNDCDDFARLAAAVAQLDNNQTSWKPKGHALAFAEFWFTEDRGGGHAINAIVIYEDNAPQLVFLEPQTGAELKLTQTEIESCDFCRF